MLGADGCVCIFHLKDEETQFICVLGIVKEIVERCRSEMFSRIEIYFMSPCKTLALLFYRDTQ